MYNINSLEGIPDNISIGKCIGCYGIAKFDFAFTDILEGQLCMIYYIIGEGFARGKGLCRVEVESKGQRVWVSTDDLCYSKEEFLIHKMTR